MSDILDPMECVAMALAVLIGMPVAIGDAASLRRGTVWAPTVVPTLDTALSPPPPRLPLPRRPEPRPTTDVPLPPEPVAPAPAPSEAPVGTEPVAAPTTTEAPPTTASPEAPRPTTESTEPPPTIASSTVTVSETSEPDPLSQPLVVRRPPAPLEILDPPPPPGTGMRVGGGILIGLGTLNTILGGLMTAWGDKDERPFGIARLAFGVVELGAGVALVGSGLRRAKRLRAYKVESSYAVPKTGNGMLVGGSVLVGLGLYDGLSAAVFVQQTGEVPVGTVAVAAMEVVAGAVLLALGSGRKRRYQRWEHDNFAATTVAPTPLPGGGALAMRGRF